MKVLLSNPGRAAIKCRIFTAVPVVYIRASHSEPGNNTVNTQTFFFCIIVAGILDIDTSVNKSMLVVNPH